MFTIPRILLICDSPCRPKYLQRGVLDLLLEIKVGSKYRYNRQLISRGRRGSERSRCKNQTVQIAHPTKFLAAGRCNFGVRQSLLRTISFRNRTVCQNCEEMFCLPASSRSVSDL